MSSFCDSDGLRIHLAFAVEITEARDGRVSAS